MELVYTILATAGLLLYYFDVVKKIFWVKPFNCEPCLSFWLAIPIFFAPKIAKEIIICATFTFIIYKQIKKIYND